MLQHVAAGLPDGALTGQAQPPGPLAGGAGRVAGCAVSLMLRDLSGRSTPNYLHSRSRGAVACRVVCCSCMDRPRRVQVLPFFRDLESLPERPDIETLRKVFSWYDDGFLKGVDTETDPVAAWRECVPLPSSAAHGR